MIRFKHLVSLVFLLNSSHSLAIPSVPNAEGFGNQSFGGSGRHLNPPLSLICHVKSLEDSGENSLRSCIEKTVPRTVVFDIGGEIKLKSELKIKSPYISIFGQTAPGRVVLTGAPLRAETDHVIVEHLELRPGDSLEGSKPETRDGCSMGVGKHIFFNQLSVSWGIDENCSTYGVGTENVTFSNSLVYEALAKSLHPENKEKPGGHSSGFLVGAHTKNISVLKNVFAHNYDRNVRIGEGASVEVIGNTFYHFGGISPWNGTNVTAPESGKGTLLTFIGNRFIPLIDSPFTPGVWGSPVSKDTRIFVKGNFSQSRQNDTDPEDWVVTPPNFTNTKILSTHLTPSPPLSSNVTLSYKPTPGARPWDKSPSDERIFDEINLKVGFFKDCLNCTDKRRVPPLELLIEEKRKVFTEPRDPFVIDGSSGYTTLEVEIFKLGGGTPQTPLPSTTKPPQSVPTNKPFPTPSPEQLAPCEKDNSFERCGIPILRQIRDLLKNR